MYGKLDEQVIGDAENFAQRFEGSELSGLAARLDTIVEMYEGGELDKGEAADLIQDISREAEIEGLAESMQVKSDFLKAASMLLQIL